MCRSPELPLFLAVVNALASGDLFADPDREGRLVGHPATLFRKIRVDNRLDVGAVRLVNHKAADIAAALDKRQRRLFVGVAASGAVLLADEGSVGLEDLAFATKRSGKCSDPHRLADAMAHKPSGLEGDAKGMMELI